MTEREVLHMALEALEYAQTDRECPSTTRQAITAIKKALAQPEKPTVRQILTVEQDDNAHPEYVRGYVAGLEAGAVSEQKSAQPEQEPVAWISTGSARMINWTSDKPAYGNDWTPLYTTPPHRKPLTDEEIMANDVLRYHFALNGGAGPISKKGRKVIDAIEAAHGIKE